MKSGMYILVRGFDRSVNYIVRQLLFRSVIIETIDLQFAEFHRRTAARIPPTRPTAIIYNSGCEEEMEKSYRRLMPRFRLVSRNKTRNSAQILSVFVYLRFVYVCGEETTRRPRKSPTDSRDEMKN